MSIALEHAVVEKFGTFVRNLPFGSVRFSSPRLGVEAMKSRDTLVRLRRFQVDETRRRVAQIETMIAEFSKMARELDREIAIEEQRAGISDISHFAYPTYARAARARRDNLQRSAEELTSQLDEARQFLDETFADPSHARLIEGGGKGPDTAAGTEVGQDGTRGVRSRRI
jgi:flagellar FliJ protein